MDDGNWQFWIDVGGTFTDCLARSPDGSELRTKVLSSAVTKGAIQAGLQPQSLHCPERVGDGPEFWNSATLRFLDPEGMQLAERQVDAFDDARGQFEWRAELAADVVRQAEHYELHLGVHAPILAIRKLLKRGPRLPIPDCSVDLGTTRGTNALLTRTGARTAFVTTAGFGDLLRIGDQARPHLFELTVRKLQPLFDTSCEIEERILADGTVERSPDPQQVARVLTELKAGGIQSVAICLVHGYRYPQHEQLVARLAREVGFAEVRTSAEVSPLIRMVPRAETTVLDAYLNPVLRRYLDEIRDSLPATSPLRLMTSAGGLVPRTRFSGKDSVLSGPAGGVVGAARVARQAGFKRAIGFDMGGTSTDVCRFDGEFEKEYESRKAGVRIVAPMMAIETVAAGGGSVCRFDGAKLVVGPESASADPGPACYGRGGPLTVTDVNLYLGRIVRSQFPFPLNEQATISRLQEICAAMKSAGHDLTPAEVAAGFLQIANNNMAHAIRSVSVARGYDPQDYLLVSFGGAGSQHCCLVADHLKIGRVLYHPQSSILSAVGIRLADCSVNRVESLSGLLTAAAISQCREQFEQMQDSAGMELRQESGLGADLDPVFRCYLDLRYVGTEAYQSVEFQSGEDLRQRFEDLHLQRFGYRQDRDIEMGAARVEASLPGNRFARSEPVGGTRDAVPAGRQPLIDPGTGLPEQAAVHDRLKMQPGDRVAAVDATAIVADEFSTVVIDQGWQATMLSDGQLLLERITDLDQSAAPQLADHSHADPIQLEIFNSHFTSIARQMGTSLQMTAASVNIKERLDFSCAVFTGDGQLVVNAPHIPVHLGAMSQTVKAIIADNPDVVRGDVYVTNDPYRGGSHLPDVTVVTPVFVPSREAPVFWVASRGHHAEIGGMAPGSMPAAATNLAEEGVLIRNFKLVDGGKDRFAELRERLTSGPYPSRAPDENMADIAAEVAANRRGTMELLKLVEQYSLEMVLAYMSHIQSAAETKARQALSALPDQEKRCCDSLDNGARICVEIRKQADALTVDFSGTDPVLDDNLNANPAIVSAAVLYVIRLLIEEDIPLNEGVLAPVNVILPECLLNPASSEDPAQCPAIVGGNVETSQRVVDVLLGGLQIAAASCGTMNNWLIGDSRFGYYETVGGGSGATAEGAGADAVHTHMTNTRLTDPETLESRYPIVIREFAIRRNSGGPGRNPGGDGMIRELEFRRPLTLTLLTSRRTSAPFGMQGGVAGEPGRNLLLDGPHQTELPSTCELQVQPGQRLRLLTPGGGGFGTPSG